jgi:hypothetical protein
MDPAMVDEIKKMNAALVPEHLQEGIEAHCLTGRPVGQFLTAVLCNNLREAVAYGDPASMEGLRGIIQFLHNYAPGGCWGSPELVQKWRDRSGLAGSERSSER